MGDNVYFRDCGALGKQVLDLDSARATLHFHTGHGSLTQRGFLLTFEGNIGFVWTRTWPVTLGMGGWLGVGATCVSMYMHPDVSS